MQIYVYTYIRICRESYLLLYIYIYVYHRDLGLIMSPSRPLTFILLKSAIYNDFHFLFCNLKCCARRIPANCALISSQRSVWAHPLGTTCWTQTTDFPS